jgi:hypothetical protein
MKTVRVCHVAVTGVSKPKGHRPTYEVTDRKDFTDNTSGLTFGYFLRTIRSQYGGVFDTKLLDYVPGSYAVLYVSAENKVLSKQQLIEASVQHGRKY